MNYEKSEEIGKENLLISSISLDMIDNVEAYNKSYLTDEQKKKIYNFCYDTLLDTELNNLFVTLFNDCTRIFDELIEFDNIEDEIGLEFE